MIDIAYYMQFFNAILSPCNRWDKSSKTAQRNYQEKNKDVLLRQYHTQPVYERNDPNRRRKPKEQVVTEI